jgi:hypothetical protein
MRRTVVELSAVAIAAAIIAGLILVAGTTIGSADQSLLSYTFRPPLCTVSYCEPAELVPTTAMPSATPTQTAATTLDAE